MIEVEGLTKVYGGSRGTRALDNVSFSVPKGSVFGFLGPNGAGKTTTIRIMGTVIEPTAGTVRVDGHDIREEPMDVKERIGLMPDEVLYYPTLTGLQHLVYYASFYGVRRAEARKRARDLLARLGLGGAEGKKVKAYSHGMRKRLSLAQCLFHDPDVMIMDEPASGLDPLGMRSYRDLIRGLATEGKTVFLSSHLLTEVEQLCERVGIIDRGKIVAVDTIATLTSQLSAGSPVVLHITATGISEEARQQLAAIPGVTGVQPTPAGVDVTTRPGVDASPEVSRTLVLAGAQLKGMATEQRSLEDLFFALTKEAGK
jgi:ABC-2 type transport system ATP-binding protein